MMSQITAGRVIVECALDLSLMEVRGDPVWQSSIPYQVVLRNEAFADPDNDSVVCLDNYMTWLCQSTSVCIDLHGRN